VRIYECSAKIGDSHSLAWRFRAPEATPADRAGHVIGKHYAGPTRESVDGSTVVGKVKEHEPGPDPGAIARLLLTSKTVNGPGTFAGATSVQRVHTMGGTAPTATCDASTIGQFGRVPYIATCIFYHAKG